MSKVSVIVPVYNVENYLAAALDSIISQTVKDIEIICINDGSVDSSAEILEKYALFDKRIKIINQENNGPSSARNTGIKEAKGEYIAFVDSDDRVSPLMIERLYEKALATEADFVYCNVIWYNCKTRKYFCVQNGVSETVEKDFPEDFFTEESVNAPLYFEIPCSAWNKLYKTEFLKTNNILFKEDVIFEDVPFFTEVYLKADRIGFDKEKYYIYSANRPESIVSEGDRRYFDAFKIIEICRQLFHDENKWEKYKTFWLIHEIKTLLIDLYKIQPELQEEFFNKIKLRYEAFYFQEYDMSILAKTQVFGFLTELLKSDFETFKVLLKKLEMVV